MMKKITSLLCGAAMVATLSSPALAGGKTVANASTTISPAAIVGVYYNKTTGMKLEVRADGQGDLYSRNGGRIGAGTISSSSVASLLRSFVKG
jgi:hypothetical protein